jgi:hypothetical protein
MKLILLLLVAIYCGGIYGEAVCIPGFNQYKLQNNATRVTFENNPASFTIKQIQANTLVGMSFYCLISFLHVREVRASDGEYIQSYDISRNWTIECTKYEI